MHIHRWVDYKAARQYVRQDAMIGRVRHWLPHEISGLDKIYAKTGLSFAIPGQGSNWNAHGREAVRFTVDRDLLENHVCNIDGQAVFEFSDIYDMRYDMPGLNLYERRLQVIERCKLKQDEAFVIGNIRRLSDHLVSIGIGSEVDKKTREQIMTYAESHAIQLEND
tara:strand:- start:282 stop:779 length:498 start_codon:yes stop_codon:yes gene_type:complete